jgi:hypothetical protein
MNEFIKYGDLIFLSLNLSIVSKIFYKGRNKSERLLGQCSTVPEQIPVPKVFLYFGYIRAAAKLPVPAASLYAVGSRTAGSYLSLQPQPNLSVSG